MLRICRATNAQTQANVVGRAHKACNAFNAVMAAVPAIFLNFHLSKRLVDFVMKHDQVIQRDFIKPHQRLHGFPRKIHKCLGFAEDHLVVTDFRLRDFGLKLIFDRRIAKTLEQIIHGHKSDVVTSEFIFSAGISQADD
ncbi:hypothetical protein D3C87_1567320 [compost metagenome]